MDQKHLNDKTNECTFPENVTIGGQWKMEVTKTMRLLTNIYYEKQMYNGYDDAYVFMP